MKKVEKHYMWAGMFLLLLSAAVVARQDGAQQMQADKERREAERTWEQMVKVKGGRVRLHAVTNMLLIMGDKPNNIGIRLYDYPDKYWHWTKAPPSPEVAWVTMANLEHQVLLIASNAGLTHSERLTEERRQAIRWERLREACAYLLEINWLQPTPLRVTRQRIGKKLMDVIETRLHDAETEREERMDFVVEPESLLVYRVIQYYEGKPLSYYCFDDYTTVDGIQMPRRTGDIDYQFWNKECRYPYALKVQFNVDYDRRIFERPPSVEAGPEAWKLKH